MADRDLSSAALSKFARQAKLSAEDRTEIDRLASQLGEDHRWMSARELEEADVVEEGQKVPFERWFREAAGQGQQAENDPTGATKLTDVEKRAIEVGTRLVHFQTHRDREIRSIEPLLVMPRPNNPTYLAFTAEVVKKARELGQDGVRDLPLMELDALKALSMYWHDLPGDDRKVPGVDAKFDAKFAAWLQEKSGWVPLRVLLDAKPELLERAGYPSRQVDGLPRRLQGPGTGRDVVARHRARRRRRPASSPRPTNWARRSTRSRTRRPRRWPARPTTTRRTPSGTRSTPTAWR